MRLKYHCNFLSLNDPVYRTSARYRRSDGVSKDNLYFDNQSLQVVFIVLVAVFLKEVENMYSLFLSSFSRILLEY